MSTRSSFAGLGGFAPEPAEYNAGHRLYKTPKEKKPKAKDEVASAAIVSDLSSDTLRWMKKRRNPNGEQKLVISVQREKQLRQMFERLDYDGKNSIDLNDLTSAFAYVQEKTKHSKGLEHFQNIQQVFEEMDDNGDGTVDFSEFLIAMTGTTKSTFDNASDYDTDRLFSHFVEYGENRAREVAWKRVQDSLNSSPSVKTNSLDTISADDNTVDETKLKKDTASLQHFKSLFGAEDSTKASSKKTVSRTGSMEYGIRQSAQMDKILQEFVLESQKLSTASSSVTNDEYNALQDKMRAERMALILQQATIVAEAGLASPSKRNAHPLTERSLLKNALLKTGSDSFDSSAPSSPANKSVAKNPTLVPIDHDVKRALELRDVARKEAFDILRAPKVEEPPPRVMPAIRSSFGGFGGPLLNIPEQRSASRLQELRGESGTPPLSGRLGSARSRAGSVSGGALPRIKTTTSTASRRAQLTRASIQF